ncbi:MAG: alpha/beta hydrolase [Alphaproteobacteria bacterium]|nr:alpha/beta hydrolase [Hyphomonas sp.]MBR9805649.1 alpha/beta hydrolase [Alphaproteobacteria bacterium]
MFRNRHFVRTARSSSLGVGALILWFLAFLLSGCASPVTQTRLSSMKPPEPVFLLEENTFVSFDGARLGLTVWPAEGTDQPDYVVIGLHGMNDYANAFHMAAPYWARQGVTTYAYDQRGFGRSPERGVWPDEEVMRQDLRTATALARHAHPDATITVVGISMGGSVALSAFGSENPPEADRLIASGPGLRGWGAMNFLYRASLWTSAHVRPGWVVRPPERFVHIEPSDNIEMLRRTWEDPLMLRDNRIDQVYGLVSLMETAHQRVPDLPPDLPVLLSYGANDYVVPPKGVKRTAKELPDHVRTVYYENGYHMLTRDLQAETVNADYLAFMVNPTGDVPSHAPEWPFR